MATISDPPAATSLPAAAPETAHATTTTAATTQDARGPVGGLPAELDTATEPFPTTSGVTASPTEAASAKELASPASSTTAIPSKDDTNPLDFQGDVQTNNNLPAPETLRKLGKYTVLDESGKSHTFKSLYTGPNVARRVLIIFIRHFFCGNCQEYLRNLSAAIAPESLLQLPVSTSIAVIGCGSYKLIKAYLQETGCPFPVYADNTQHLYTELGMIRTLSAGARPAYMQNRSMAQTVFSGIMQGLKQVKSGLVLQMGDQKQVGGEFLFEPASLSVESPIATPHAELRDAPLMDLDDSANSRENEKGEEKMVTWCHRMRNTRDHAEIPELMDVLGLDRPELATSDGASSLKGGRKDKNEERWAKAVRSRKGTGLSMASRMSRMSMDAKGQQGHVPESAKP